MAQLNEARAGRQSVATLLKNIWIFIVAKFACQFFFSSEILTQPLFFL